MVWFWLDKAPMPPAISNADSPLLVNFQFAVDLAKRGYVSEAYAFIWRAHYLVLSILGGLLASMAYSVLSRAVARRRYRLPRRPQPVRQEGADVPAQPEARSADQDM